ncbi:long chain base biosynthesis protein 1b-like [Asparagus officinalis]|uniref:long chain base biosynthesis protein 1b-like n=1 Tax=Asparagus officinalis TaxID=4686 RepID=UPI00098E37E7|nr:long chain base biosynthesis protein 1b-like [Asparagus officinalis]
MAEAETSPRVQDVSPALGDTRTRRRRSDLVLNEDSVFLVSTKRSKMDKYRLPVDIRMFVSAGHSESDLTKVLESSKRVATSVLFEVA